MAIELRFSEQAEREWYTMRDAVDTEIASFGVPALIIDGDKIEIDPLYVERMLIPPQLCTSTTVNFDPDKLVAWMDQQEQELLDLGYPDGTIFERYYFHTHPGNSADPSSTDIQDQNTRLGNGFPFYINCILARGGDEWGKLSIQIAGTKKYVHNKLDFVYERSIIPEIAELAREMVEKKVYTYHHHNQHNYHSHHSGGGYHQPSLPISPKTIEPREKNPESIPFKLDFEDIPEVVGNDAPVHLRGKRINDLNDVEWAEYLESPYL